MRMVSIDMATSECGWESPVLSARASHGRSGCTGRALRSLPPKDWHSAAWLVLVRRRKPSAERSRTSGDGDRWRACRNETLGEALQPLELRRARGPARTRRPGFTRGRSRAATASGHLPCPCGPRPRNDSPVTYAPDGTPGPPRPPPVRRNISSSVSPSSSVDGSWQNEQRRTRASMRLKLSNDGGN